MRRPHRWICSPMQQLRWRRESRDPKRPVTHTRAGTAARHANARTTTIHANTVLSDVNGAQTLELSTRAGTLQSVRECAPLIRKLASSQQRCKYIKAYVVMLLGSDCKHTAMSTVTEGRLKCANPALAQNGYRNPGKQLADILFWKRCLIVASRGPRGHPQMYRGTISARPSEGMNPASVIKHVERSQEAVVCLCIPRRGEACWDVW